MVQAVERVRDYPRPPRLESVERDFRIELAGEAIMRADRAFRVLETFHPPTYYFARAAFRPGVPVPSARSSLCEWKGRARCWSLAGAGGLTVLDAAWEYPEPAPPFAALRDHIAVYPGLVDACFVDGERVRPQPGGFYGGWITSELVGPFKGEPGTAFW